MAWKSSSFQRNAQTGALAPASSVRNTTQNHKREMDRVVEDARQLSRDRTTTLDQITDPKLRKSAAK